MAKHIHRNLAEGYVRGAILLAIGVILQLTIGPVEWSAFAWPTNAITLSIFVVLIVLAHFFSKHSVALQYLSSVHASVSTLVYALALTIVMGLTRQKEEGTWFSNMLTFWPFVLIYAKMAFILGMVTLKRLNAMFSKNSPHRFSLHNLAFILNHAGLFIAIVCATLGNADIRRLKMITATHTLQWRAIDEQMRVMDMPIAIELKRFIMEEYDDGTPKRFASDIEIVTRTGKDFCATVDVNHPVKVDGWKIYQFDYDADLGSKSQTSILAFVRDPWLPSVYVGIFMMLAGALLMFLGTESGPGTGMHESSTFDRFSKSHNNSNL